MKKEKKENIVYTKWRRDFNEVYSNYIELCVIILILNSKI